MEQHTQHEYNGMQKFMLKTCYIPKQHNMLASIYKQLNYAYPISTKNRTLISNTNQTILSYAYTISTKNRTLISNTNQTILKAAPVVKQILNSNITIIFHNSAVNNAIATLTNNILMSKKISSNFKLPQSIPMTPS